MGLVKYVNSIVRNTFENIVARCRVGYKNSEIRIREEILVCQLLFFVCLVFIMFI